ncbi:MAG: FlgD immunoglobulin-like domain containing protein, partial [bacterium]
FVSAETADPLEYYDSPVDSGYSVDNLAPGPPEGLHMASATEVAWEEAPEEDFDYFAVYGSDDGHFGGADFIGYTIGIYMDVSGDLYGFYHVTATDFAGNEGEPATVENDFAGISGGSVPAVYALRRNVPNPFTESTRISFDLPERSHVVIDIVDVGGRLVRTLVDDTRVADRHHATWDGRDGSGAEVGPGVYFLRMKAGEFSATRKMMLLK